MMELNVIIVLLILFLIYKFLDRIVRLFNIGKYNERYVFITGCDTGFGNILAKRLDGKGCHVFAVCLTDKGQTELNATSSDRLVTLPLDVTKPESVRKALQIVKSKLPPGKGLWGLVNNAGLMGYMGPPEFQSRAEYNLVFEVNTFGLIDVTMAFLPLVKAEKGRIVSTASVAGRISNTQAVPYCMSKYSVEAFMDGLRRSLYPYGVQCSIVEPGGYLTPFLDKSEPERGVMRSFVKDWNDLPPEVREEFGQEYHTHISTKLLDAFRGYGSTKLDDVVDAYEHGLFGSYPRGRYVVGYDARFIWIPLTYLNEWMSDSLLRLAGPQKPLPAILKKKKNL